MKFLIKLKTRSRHARSSPQLSLRVFLARVLSSSTDSKMQKSVQKLLEITESKRLPLAVFLPRELTSAALNASNPKKNTRKWLGRVIANSTKITVLALSRVSLFLNAKQNNLS